MTERESKRGEPSRLEIERAGRRHRNYYCRYDWYRRIESQYNEEFPDVLELYKLAGIPEPAIIGIRARNGRIRGKREGKRHGRVREGRGGKSLKRPSATRVSIHRIPSGRFRKKERREGRREGSEKPPLANLANNENA